MVTISVEVRQDAVARTVRVTARSIERALKIVGGGRPGVQARVVFPIEPETFFAAPGAPEGVMAGELLSERAAA